MAEPSVNLLAWLRPDRIVVAFADQAWPLQAATAADWLGAMAMDFSALSGVFPGLIQDEHIDAMVELVKDRSRQETMTAAAQKVIQAAGGRDWWWTINLTKKATSAWMIVNGFLVRQGVRADATSLPDWLDACYSFLWEQRDEDGRITLDMELSLPPRGMRGSKAANKRMLEAFQAD